MERVQILRKISDLHLELARCYGYYANLSPDVLRVEIVGGLEAATGQKREIAPAVIKEIVTENKEAVKTLGTLSDAAPTLPAKPRANKSSKPAKPVTPVEPVEAVVAPEEQAEPAKTAQEILASISTASDTSADTARVAMELLAAAKEVKAAVKKEATTEVPAKEESEAKQRAAIRQKVQDKLAEFKLAREEFKDFLPTEKANELYNTYILAVVHELNGSAGGNFLDNLPLQQAAISALKVTTSIALAIEKAKEIYNNNKDLDPLDL